MVKNKFTQIIKSLFGKKGSLGESSIKTAELYLNLRRNVFNLASQTKLPANEFGLYALVREYLLEEVVVTEVYVCDGSTSLYFSNGGGRIGGGNDESVRSATLRLFEEIGPSYKTFSVHSSPPLPTQQGVTFFYFVSVSGTHAAAALTDDLQHEDHLLHNIFHATELVKTIMRSLDTKN